MIPSIEATASHILSQSPGPVVRYRLLRDVLRRPPADAELQQAKANLDGDTCVQKLGNEQWTDGGWGAFHSRSTKLKQVVPSTEVGVERALALGLDLSHPILKRAHVYLLAILEGKIPIPDYAEKNDRWPTGVRLFPASTLSLIEPSHPILDSDRELWRSIAQHTFRSGRYSAEDEIEVHKRLTGATVKDSYLVLSSRYQLNLLGSVPGLLSPHLERALLAWLWELPWGIGYLTVPLRVPPQPKPGVIDRWLASHEMLARLFPAWVEFAAPVMDWLWGQRDGQGLWDFGPKPESIACLPYTDSWREPKNRLFDWTTRVLILLRCYYDSLG
ncbi:MAG: hypothetical protein AB1531_05940 [Chloroflexota bacterium]